MEFRQREFRDTQGHVRLLAVVERPGYRQAATREDPTQQPFPLKRGYLGHNVQASREPGRIGRDGPGDIGQVGVREEGREVESTLADQALRIDGKPSRITEIEDVFAVEVSVERNDLLRVGEQGTRDLGGCEAVAIRTLDEVAVPRTTR